MILLHSTDIEKARANIQTSNRDDSQSSEKNQSDNDMDLNAEGK